MKTTTVNKEQKLFVFNNGNSYTCLGFDVVIGKISRLRKELNLPEKKFNKGSISSLKELKRLQKIVYKMYIETQFRSKAELIPEFIGNEGRRVEVTDSDGEKRRFTIGKSTGWIPCHLEILRSNSTGGATVTSFKSFRFID